MGTSQFAVFGILALIIAATDSTLKIDEEHARSSRTQRSELIRVKRGETNEELSRVKRLQDPLAENAIEDNLPKDRLSRVKRIGDDHSNRTKRQVLLNVSRQKHRLKAADNAVVHKKAGKQSGTYHKRVHKKRNHPKHVGLKTMSCHSPKSNRLQKLRNAKKPVVRIKPRHYHRKIR